jgi:hypothetical protein
MKKINFFILMFHVFFILILIPSMSSVFAQDIAELESEKYLLQVDNQTFQIFYGFKGSLEIEIGEKVIEDAKVTSMIINPERRSLEINFEESPYEGPMWVRLPNELMSAEGGKFQVLVDDNEKRYELTYYADKIAVGFILPSSAKQVEIIGTRVIPEFTTTIIIFGIAMFSIFYFFRKSFKMSLNCR